MKRYFYTSMLAAYFFAIADESTEDKPRITVEQIVLQTIINQQSKQNNASPKFGKKLIDYLNNLDTKTFKDTFLALPYRAKIMYLLDISPQEYEFFLERFDNKQWQGLWTQLSPAEQQHIPKTKTEQITILRNTYRAYCKHICGWFSTVEKASPYPSDLKKFKQKCYKDPYSDGESIYSARCSSRELFLYAYLFKERLKLFNL